MNYFFKYIFGIYVSENETINDDAVNKGLIRSHHLLVRSRSYTTLRMEVALSTCILYLLCIHVIFDYRSFFTYGIIGML